MLNRCVATNRCCPKLHEEDLEATEGQNATMHLYSNPYMLEEMAFPQALQYSLDNTPDGADFPPGALSLMYSPPPEAEDEFSDEEWLQEESASPSQVVVDAYLNVPHLMRPNLRETLRSLQGSLDATPSGTRPTAQRPEGGRGRSSSPSRVAFAEEGNAGVARSSSASRLSGPGNTQPMSWTVRARSPTPAPMTPRRSEGDSGDVQPEALSRDALQLRSTSRTLASNGSCASHVGASSIAAIMACVKKAETLPEQQRPNSDKWVDRWSSSHLEQYVK
mmetsp:Transcript_9338/g.20786  ORF Transcript_9338/g.20786 Transcript_9338/m.20786 type:complete len:277 (-) Transcript_9338:87-917(-)